MKIHFLGANRQVTGSRYCVEAGGEFIMVDCGMFQEREFQIRNWANSPISPKLIKTLLLTHVHIDHCGLLPRLTAEGFRGSIRCTEPSADMLPVMLRDSAKIQTEDAKYKRKRHNREGRKGKYPEQALYDIEDVEKTLPLIKAVKFEHDYQVTPAIKARFHEAGHILGSAMISMEITEDDKTRRVIFSGDIGQWNKPIIRDPTLFQEADYVVMESTYGDRDHTDGGELETQFETIINETVRRGGNVVIPTFAVERAQELMYYISTLVHRDQIPDIPIFLDSPMAVDVTEIFRKHRDYFDDETWKKILDKEPPLQFPGLKMCRSVDDSKAIRNNKGPCIIMATAGMCTAGRIKHHLRANIEDRNSTILFVGYQGRG
ncbi:MAG: metallo-beta-lactamase family protein, partial [Pirellulaceae bacterium]